jgi:hypothetical protein
MAYTLITQFKEVNNMTQNAIASAAPRDVKVLLPRFFCNA